MPYRYLDDIATADAAFEAWGASLEELFIAAADALLNVMVENLETIAGRERRTIRCEAESLGMLLIRFLEELVFIKDAQRLFLRVERLGIEQTGDMWNLVAQVYGEEINPERHELNADVKAVTYHRFSLEQCGQEWRATVVLDI
ncbi:archease [bacterium]|nr:archease [bacterium]